MYTAEPGGTGVCGISSMILDGKGTESVHVVEAVQFILRVCPESPSDPSPIALHAAALIQESTRSEGKSFSTGSCKLPEDSASNANLRRSFVEVLYT